ncbi:hypothetical protein AB0M97_26060 [Streptomyces sp. NPDC051207]|uniref:hypothetical protein n=1 Tax=Streptomyces sp. NPDC051207 TaxID=3154641 RepID=UPI00341BD2A6
MTEHTPSQAEGERDDGPATERSYDPPWTTPSQAEGEREDETSTPEERPLPGPSDR